MVSSLLEQAALVVEKNRFRHSRLINYFNGCTLQPPYELNGTDIASLLAFRTSAALKRDTLVFREALEAIPLNVLKVREQVSTTVIRSDKAETF
jgi:hypothetical protein